VCRRTPLESVDAAGTSQEKANASISAKPKKLERGILPAWVYQLRDKVYLLLEDVMDELGPWIKWIIYDALLTLVIGWLVHRLEFLRPVFEAVGWA